MTVYTSSPKASTIDISSWGGVSSDIHPKLTIGITKANGGFIIQCRTDSNAVWDYYVIHDNAKNFDKELGKIISMHLLRD